MRFYLFIFIIISMTACIQPLDLETKYRFEDAKKQIDTNLTNHFDLVVNKYNHAIFRYPISHHVNDGLEITLFVPRIKGNYNTSLLLKDKAIGAVRFDSDCKLIVDKPSSNSEYLASKCDGQIYPIPDYSIWWSDIPKDLTFYILDYKGGHFLPDSLLTNGGGMPENLKNGFSKGFALSEKKGKIVFWLIVW